MKTIGLLGGMSWESTIPYYRLINEGVKQHLGGLHSANLLLHSVDFHDIEACQSSGEWVNVSSCTMGGYVGSYTTYKDNPTSAPAATVHNAFSYKNDEYYDPTINN